MEVQKKLLLRYIANRFATDNIIQLVYSMKPDLVEQLLIIPEIEELEKKIGYKGKLTVTVFINYLKELVSHLRIMSLGTDNESKHLSFHIRI